MKFRKVEIQAFRAYTDVKDGTFDFSVADGNDIRIADFISLYAPNGFGKTSFYDAVEYGFTNSIDRFLKNVSLNKDVAKSERSVAENKKGQYILRNRMAPDDLKSEIKIYTTDPVNAIEKEILPNKRKDSTDFHFDNKQVTNKFFQTVILSQEWIDAFLKVDDPSDRYDKFMEWFGDTENATYYKRLIELINQNNKKIDDIKKLLQGVQKELDFSGDKDILKKLNDKILELKNSGETLKFVEESFSDAEALNLSNFISERLSDISFEIIQLESRGAYVDLLFSGNEDIKGLETYYNSKRQQDEANIKLKELNSVLEKFIQTEKNQIEFQKLSDILVTYSNLKGQLSQIEEKFPLYLKVRDQINVSNNLIETEKSNIGLINKQILDEKLRLSDAENKIKEINSQVADQQKYIAELNRLRERSKSHQERKGQVDLDIQSLDDKIKLIENSRKDLENELSSERTLLTNISNQIYIEPDIKPDLETLSGLVKENQQSYDDLLSKRQSYDKLQAQIESQENLNKDIEDFIAKGLELINKSSTSTCLLCNQEYKSFEDLSKRVTKNIFLSRTVSDLLTSRSSLEADIEKITESLKKNDEFIVDFLNRRVIDKQKKFSELYNDLQSAQQNHQKLLFEKQDISAYDLEYENWLGGLTYDIQLQNRKAGLKSLEENLISANSQKDQIHLLIQNLSLDVSNIENRVKLILEANIKLHEDADFLKVTNYFSATFPDEVISLNIIRDAAVANNKSIDELNIQLEEIQDRNKSLEQELINTTKELTKKQIELLEKSGELLQQVHTSFEREVNSKLKVEISELPKEGLIENLNAIKANSEAALSKWQVVLKNYSLLIELKKNVEPYLKFTKSQRTAAELKSKRSFLEKKVRKILDEERTKTADYLNNQIKSFFYEDLINDLYRRIDPHPDYKRVRFNCDFKDDKPKLNVFLYKDDADIDPIIPNLYFSTAQLNILSLSIFLAKALNAKDDSGVPIDCIFIDDPIQSMDSINILSTIDLLRSLVINKGKQIILSTHDENFHNLLKKKIPVNLFNSKFLELETFGKIKQ